jgi:hypothetical protein
MGQKSMLVKEPANTSHEENPSTRRHFSTEDKIMHNITKRICRDDRIF